MTSFDRPQDMGHASDESGLVAFAALLAMHRLAVDPAQLRHGLGHHLAITSHSYRVCGLLPASKKGRPRGDALFRLKAV